MLCFTGTQPPLSLWYQGFGEVGFLRECTRHELNSHSIQIKSDLSNTQIKHYPAADIGVVAWGGGGGGASPLPKVIQNWGPIFCMCSWILVFKVFIHIIFLTYASIMTTRYPQIYLCSFWISRIIKSSIHLDFMVAVVLWPVVYWPSNFRTIRPDFSLSRQ